MRVRRAALTAAAAGLVALVLPAATASAQTSKLVGSEHIITTLYAYPGLSVWDQVTSSAPTVSASIVDMCAANGTGSGCDGEPWSEQPPGAWTAQIQALREAGITPLVYISTDYGNESGSPDFSLSTVESEVANAVSWYGKGIGFMFDEAQSTCSVESSYYAPLYAYVKSVTDNGTVELNPGDDSEPSCFMAASDILQVYEGTEAAFQTTTFPSWMASYPASRFAATISAGTSAGVSTDVSDAAKDGIGNVYVDDEAEPPNYSTLPAFWSAEVADVAGLASAGPAPQHIVTTLYAAPTASSWTSVEDSAPVVRAAIVDICAPDGSGSGCNGEPADAENPLWPPTIAALLSAGVTPLYYISTDYAATPLATVESEISDAVSWYGTPSIMLDEVPTSCSDVSYYQALYSYIHNLGGIVMLDPGTVTSTSSCYMPVSDILQVFSGSRATFETTTFPSWMASYASSRFSAVISAGTSADLSSDVADAGADGLGNVYIDDEAEPPTYATLPAFWSTEVSDVQAEP
jgi:Spherulation-specific family 4